MLNEMIDLGLRFRDAKEAIKLENEELDRLEDLADGQSY